jgi:hypothetical protein
MCWSGSSVRADLCIMTGDRRLLQIDKEDGPEPMPCSIVRGMVRKLVRKLVVKTWMFLDAAVGEWARTHTIVSAESMATSSALRPSPQSHLLPLLTGKAAVAEVVIERSGPRTGRALRGDTSITTPHTPFTRSQKGSPIDNILGTAVALQNTARVGTSS